MIRSQDPDLGFPSDVYVSPSQILTFGLQDGQELFASIRPPAQEEHYYAFTDKIGA